MPRLKTASSTPHSPGMQRGQVKAAAKTGIGRPETTYSAASARGLPAAAQARSLTRISPRAARSPPSLEAMLTASPKKSVRGSAGCHRHRSRCWPDAASVGRREALSGQLCWIASAARSACAASGNTAKTLSASCFTISPPASTIGASEHLHAADQGEVCQDAGAPDRDRKSVMSSTSAARVTWKVLRIRASIAGRSAGAAAFRVSSR